MKLKNIDEFVNTLIEKAKEVVKEVEHRPLFILDSKNTIVLIQTNFRNEFDKVLTAKLIQAKLKELNSDFYVFIDEVWVVQLETKKERENYKKNPISASIHPQRREMLFVNFVNREGFMKTWFYPIRKSANGKRYLGRPTIRDNREDNRNAEGKFIFKW